MSGLALILWTPLRHNATKEVSDERMPTVIQRDLHTGSTGIVRAGRQEHQPAGEGSRRRSNHLEPLAGGGERGGRVAHAVETTEELKALRREVQQLRLERDILKKAAAFSVKESA